MYNTVIDRIEIYKLDVPFYEPFVISLGTITAANNIAIRIHTKCGLVGTGEASPFVYIVGETQATDFELAKDFAKLLIGRDPLEIENRIKELDSAISANYTIKSAFDMAIYDVASQKAGMPLYKFLGGANNRRIFTDMTVSINTPEYMAKKALQYKNDGFPALKVKLGTTTELDVARIKAIREAVGYDIPLRIDANQGWNAVTAIRTLKALEPYNVEHCEEPVPHWNNADLVRVREQSPISIMADESVFDHHDAFRLASLGACDYFNVKLSKCGGIFNSLKIIAIAESAGIKTQVGCMNETRLALTALTHLVAARNNIVHFDIDSCYQQTLDPVVGGIENVGGGEWRLPETPGLGAKFDPEYLAKMENVVIGNC
ncbi:MAG: mandelate racemase/muconate lactonizing enzyme family protein [Thermoguttaceae bacterium]